MDRDRIFGHSRSVGGHHPQECAGRGSKKRHGALVGLLRRGGVGSLERCPDQTKGGKAET